MAIVSFLTELDSENLCPLTLDLSGFQSAFNRHLLSLGYF